MITPEKTIRIGSGAGYSGDRIEPAVDLIKEGNIDYIVFECLAERTIALAQLQKMEDPALGYDPLLEARMRACLPLCVSNSVKLISNMGAANPVAAARKTAALAKELGLKNLKIAAVYGDDVKSLLYDKQHNFLESNDP
ncbi:MAG: acyclic terpene utilization AtuA family protein, partial [Cyclobacteriaceae bacterium]